MLLRNQVLALLQPQVSWLCDERGALPSVECFAPNKYDPPLVWSYCLRTSAALCDYRLSRWPSRAASPASACQRQDGSSVKSRDVSQATGILPLLSPLLQESEDPREKDSLPPAVQDTGCRLLTTGQGKGFERSPELCGPGRYVLVVVPRCDSLLTPVRIQTSHRMSRLGAEGGRQAKSDAQPPG